VLDATSGDLPPYRFSYLIEKAKQYASQVQSFGAALLAAIEKRDAQHLEVLRQTQQQNILTMTTNMRLWEVDTAQNAVDALSAQLDTVTARRDYFQGLIDAGPNTWENTRAGSQYLASGLHVSASEMMSSAGLLFLIPDIGSPFALKFGGTQTGQSAAQLAGALRDDARSFESIAASADVLAVFARRAESWRHEVDMANLELAQINKQLLGANIRLKIAQRALDIHNKTIDQGQQILDFYQGRFSSLGLYTWLSTAMQTLYRQAYAGAYAMARLAEQAYRFERNDDTAPMLSGSYFNPQYGGLLAGETLLAELQDMERRFIETNYRTLEIDQAFSLAQIAPDALVSLRENASCTFAIPEVFFDLFYPGQYRRRIKAVRLTIPCVTGPYTNVSATLTLQESRIRLTKDATDLTTVPPRRSVASAASTAQNDAGIFEFSFRDERYMPFEGAGAVSSWTIELPSAFRQFDYETISDVILRIAYIAEQDDGLREKVEQQNGAIVKALTQSGPDGKQPLRRLFSLRQEFPTAFNRIRHSAPNTQVKLAIADKHLPIFLRNRNIQMTKAELLLRTPPSQSLQNLNIKVDATNCTSFPADPVLGNLPSCAVTLAPGLIGDHTISIANAGQLAPQPPAPGDPSAIDETKLLDLMLYVEYKLN
jgi:hypothetical protein